MMIAAIISNPEIVSWMISVFFNLIQGYIRNKEIHVKINITIFLKIIMKKEVFYREGPDNNLRD